MRRNATGANDKCNDFFHDNANGFSGTVFGMLDDRAGGERKAYMFESKTEIRIHDTDAAGRVFFANYFRMAHISYEAFMKSIGHGLDKIVHESDFLLPVVRAEADYKKGLRLGDVLNISLTAQVRKRSFVLSYRFTDAQGNVAAELKTVHACIDRKTGKPIPMREDIKEALAAIA